MDELEKRLERFETNIRRAVVEPAVAEVRSYGDAKLDQLNELADDLEKRLKGDYVQYEQALRAISDDAKAVVEAAETDVLCGGASDQRPDLDDLPQLLLQC